MQYSDLVVDAFDQSKTDLVIRMTVGGNTIPMGFDQLGKLPVRFQALPFQAVFPALEKGVGAAFGTVVPELSKIFLEDVGRPPVRLFVDSVVCDVYNCFIGQSYACRALLPCIERTDEERSSAVNMVPWAAPGAFGSCNPCSARCAPRHLCPGSAIKRHCRRAARRSRASARLGPDAPDTCHRAYARLRTTSPAPPPPHLG